MFGQKTKAAAADNIDLVMIKFVRCQGQGVSKVGIKLCAALEEFDGRRMVVLQRKAISNDCLSLSSSSWSGSS